MSLWVHLLEQNYASLLVYSLSGLATIIGKNNVGLYRDDGLAIWKNTPGPDTERIKKKIIKFFQQNGFENYD